MPPFGTFASFLSTDEVNRLEKESERLICVRWIKLVHIHNEMKISRVENECYLTRASQMRCSISHLYFGGARFEQRMKIPRNIPWISSVPPHAFVGCALNKVAAAPFHTPSDSLLPNYSTVNSLKLMNVKINYKLISKNASASFTLDTCAHTNISNLKMYFGFPICSISRYLTFVPTKTYKGP